MVVVDNFFKYDGTTKSIDDIHRYLIEKHGFNNSYLFVVGKDMFEIIYSDSETDTFSKTRVHKDEYVFFLNDLHPFNPRVHTEESFIQNLKSGSFTFPAGEKEELPLEEEPCIIELRLGESKMVYNSVTRLVTLFTSNGVCTNCEMPENWSYTRIFQFMDSLTKAEKLMV